MERYEGDHRRHQRHGLATAKMLLDGGARVLVTGRSQAGLESAQREIGDRALVVASDARNCAGGSIRLVGLGRAW